MARLGHRGPATALCLIVVLDTGGVEGLAPIDEERRARLRLLRQHASDVVLPAAVLAEGVFSGHMGHDFHVRRLLDLVGIIEVGAPTGHAAGALRRDAMNGGFDPPPSGIDALVVAAADERAATDRVMIVTTDRDDFELLGSLARNADRLSVIAV